MKLGNEDVGQILALLDATSYKEMHLQTDDFKLILRRNDNGTWTQAGQVLSEANQLRAIGQETDDIPASEKTVDSIQPVDAEGLIDICTPLPGTFYRAAKPGSPPFVETGTHVGKETIIGIIETMKLMNSIYAGVSGQVMEICVDNAEFADKGTVLMRVQADQK